MSEKQKEAPVDLGHEVESIRLRPLVYFFVWLGLATAIVCVLMFVLFQFFQKSAEETDPPRSPLASERQLIPPQPRLQLAPDDPEQKKPDIKEQHPLEEMRRLREEEENAVNSYGWIDEKAGVVKLPIERAKELLLERGGLQVRPPEILDPKSKLAIETLSVPTIRPGESKKPAESKPAEKTREKHQ